MFGPDGFSVEFPHLDHLQEYPPPIFEQLVLACRTGWGLLRYSTKNLCRFISTIARLRVTGL
jgi:hypothetical protein